MVVTYKDWHSMLPFSLHGYYTSVRASTGATPFSLVYGMEAILPIEVEIPSLRVLMEAELHGYHHFCYHLVPCSLYIPFSLLCNGNLCKYILSFWNKIVFFLSLSVHHAFTNDILEGNNILNSKALHLL